MSLFSSVCLLCLAWNSHFNDVVGRKHPSIWLLISCLKDEEVLYKQRAAAAEKGLSFYEKI